MTQDAGGRPRHAPTPGEWDRIVAALDSLARTVRGHPEEGHTGLMGRVVRLERLFWAMAGALFAVGAEHAPAFVTWVADGLPVPP